MCFQPVAIVEDLIDRLSHLTWPTQSPTGNAAKSPLHDAPPSPPYSPDINRNPLPESPPGPANGTGTSVPRIVVNGPSTVAGGSTSAHASGHPSGPQDRDPTAEAVSQLLGTMQCILGAVGKTFDVVGDQTMRVASLGPAVDALYQVCPWRISYVGDGLITFGLRYAL